MACGDRVECGVSHRDFGLGRGKHGAHKVDGYPGVALPVRRPQSRDCGVAMHERGLDPLRTNPCDPDLRPMNYPRVWMLPGRLGLDDGSTVILGIFLGATFLVAVLVLVRRVTSIRGTISLLAICSPSCLLIVERANIDIIIFALVVAAAELSTVARRTAWALVPICVASVLKLYPAICIVALGIHRPRRDVVRGALAALLGLSAYLVLSRADLRLISRGTPRSTELAYGSSVLFDVVGWPGDGSRDGSGLLLLFFASAGAAVVGLRVRRARTPSGEPPRSPDATFVLGTAFVPRDLRPRGQLRLPPHHAAPSRPTTVEVDRHLGRVTVCVGDLAAHHRRHVARAGSVRAPRCAGRR